MPRITAGLAEMLLAAAVGDLGGARVELSHDACVTVVVASGGYPGSYRTGVEVSGLDAASAVDGAHVFHSGTAERGGRVVTSGGRVLAVSGLGATIAEARSRAYEACSHIGFEGIYYRRDIAQRAAEGGRR